MKCVNCSRFNFHLDRITSIGICAEWVETVPYDSSCNRYMRETRTASHSPLSINGKTYPHYLALTKGVDWVTGQMLPYKKIEAIAKIYKIDLELIKQFKGRIINPLQIEMEL